MKKTHSLVPLILTLLFNPTAVAQEEQPQETKRVYGAVVSMARDWKKPPGYWTDARARALADLVVETLGPLDAKQTDRLLTDPVCRRSFDRILRLMGRGLPIEPVPEKGEFSRIWNQKVFELSLVRIKPTLRRSASKLNMPEEDRLKARDQARQITSAVARALAPAQEYLEDETLVALLRQQNSRREARKQDPIFNDAETLFSAIKRFGKSALEDAPDQFDRIEFARPLGDEAFKASLDAARRHTSNYIAQGLLKRAVDSLAYAREFERLFETLISDLYQAPIAEHFPPVKVEPDPKEQELLAEIKTMKEELISILGIGGLSGLTVSEELRRYVGKAYNSRTYKTRKAGSSPTSATYIMDIEEVKWSRANFEIILRNDVVFGAARDGLRITSVREGSMLAARGFKASDVIQSINNISIKSVKDIIALRENPAFDKPRLINVKINRNGKTMYLRYSIPRRPR